MKIRLTYTLAPMCSLSICRLEKLSCAGGRIGILMNLQLQKMYANHIFNLAGTVIFRFCDHINVPPS